MERLYQTMDKDQSDISLIYNQLKEYYRQHEQDLTTISIISPSNDFNDHLCIQNYLKKFY